MKATRVKMFNQLNKCHNTKDFRKLAQKRIPSPIFHYLDGGADDETTLARNTDSFPSDRSCALAPSTGGGCRRKSELEKSASSCQKEFARMASKERQVFSKLFVLHCSGPLDETPPSSRRPPRRARRRRRRGRATRPVAAASTRPCPCADRD